MNRVKKIDETICLSAYAKKNLTLDEKVQLFEDWEEDRGSDGEYVYDLDYKEDALSWVELYGLDSLYKARNEGRYWLGGWQFQYNGKNTSSRCHAWCLTDRSLEDQLLDCNLYGEIADRFQIYLDENKTAEDAIEQCNKIYHGLIDFKGYYERAYVGKYPIVIVIQGYTRQPSNAERDERIIKCIKHIDANLGVHIESVEVQH